MAWKPEQEGGFQRGVQIVLMPLSCSGLTFFGGVGRDQQTGRAGNQGLVATGSSFRAVFSEESRVTGILGMVTHLPPGGAELEVGPIPTLSTRLQLLMR